MVPVLLVRERETLTKTTENGIRVLQAIRNWCETHVTDFISEDGTKTEKRPELPSARDIIFTSEVPQASVYRLLKRATQADSRHGELIELGYVTTSYVDDKTVFQLTPLGVKVLGEVPDSVEINDTVYEAIEPNEVEDEELLTAVGYYHDYHGFSEV